MVSLGDRAVVRLDSQLSDSSRISLVFIFFNGYCQTAKKN
jgi:hypothetical protein